MADDFTFSNEPDRYDQERVDRLNPVREAIQALQLPTMRTRKLLTLANALEVQVEDGGDSPEVNRLLGEALRAGLRHQVSEEEAEDVLQALDAFEDAEAARWKQVKAGTLPSVPPSPAERLDEMIMHGYSLRKTADLPTTCDRWLEAWDLFLQLHQPEWRTLAAMEAAYEEDLALLSDWCWSIIAELGFAGRTNPKYHQACLRVSREFLERFPDEDVELRVRMMQAQGDALWGLGRRTEAEAAFGAIIERFPDEPDGYLAWAYQYWDRDGVPQDFEQAEAVLKLALTRPGLTDRPTVLETLEDLYRAWGKRAAANAVAAEQRWLASQYVPAAPARAAGPVVAITGKKLPRNAPCWCGSGKKYKKCHLEADEAAAR